MRKLLVSAAVLALTAFGGISGAKAQDADTGPIAAATGSGGDVAVTLGAGMFAAYTLGMAYIVYQDIAGGGLNRQRVEVVPGAGYSTSLAARLNNSPELVASLASWKRAEEYEALASASR